MNFSLQCLYFIVRSVSDNKKKTEVQCWMTEEELGP